jgi:acyl transferase domain-containing protein/acyl carrier protein/ubiquinone/menaquinone biosynthesis C-methylase UbiE
MIAKFSVLSAELQFPAVDSLRAPVRSTVNGEIISEGSLLKIALENTLLKPAHWYKTLESAITQLPENHKAVAFAGLGSQIPASLIHSSGLEILQLGNLRGSQLEFPGRPPSLNGFANGTPVNGNHSRNANLENGQHRDFDYPLHSIAIVGMSGRFPGADDLDELWDLLLSGGITVKPASASRLRLPGPKIGDASGTQWWGNFLNDPDCFDHRFFKKSSREAVHWDPQQRILLEVVYEALESAGYFHASSDTQPDDYGCYIGAVMNNYYDNVSCHPATAYATIGTSRCFLSGCMSHYFGWTGPSLTIDTACSSSLVAINTACRAIWSGECSRAIAGGTNVITSPFDYQNLHAAGFLSPSGQCKPFDASADGYCRGEGIGVVVLKLLSTALDENDNILGVIVGSAANQNDNLSHITVPHSRSQVKLYQKVMDLAGVEPGIVSYVEAHGTGTGVGDPVEYQSIREAFAGPSRDTVLYFGSIKGNIGHTEATAGIAGLIKVLLMMQHERIPAQASHIKMNPKIPILASDHMAISRSLLPWNPAVRVACVNSYGAAGSNAAIILRQAPPKALLPLNASQKAASSLLKYPLFISAGSARSLSMYCQKLTKWLEKLESDNTAKVSVADLTFNLADRANHSLPHILSTTVTNIDDLKLKISTAATRTSSTEARNPKPVVLVFGGQESGFVGLSEDIYESSVLFRHHLDSCNDTLRLLGLEGIYPSIFQHDPISNLVTLHAALFSIQYAAAKAWITSGLNVDAIIGHSFGQLTALCVSGTLSLQDALKLVTGRASIMLRYWGSERGSMIFLQIDEQKVLEILDLLAAQEGERAEVACYNGPKSHVVVGSAVAIEALEKLMAESPSLSSIRRKRLRVTHGFHSCFTESLIPHLTALARSLEWKCPSTHLETCDEVQGVTQPDFRLISRHTRRPVYFRQAVERVTQRFPQSLWIEAGCGSSIISLTRGCIGDIKGHLFLSPQLSTPNAQESLTDTTIELWKEGYSVQYWHFHRSQRSHYLSLSLPPYQFEKTQLWLPFTGRGTETVADTKPDEHLPTVYDLLTFINFKDDIKREALFRISPRSDRFKAMLGGHVMAGQSLAPASLYFEIAARAALFLQSDIAAKTYVPTVQDLVMKSPIGLDIDRDIVLCLKQLENSRPFWQFSITTQSPPSASGHISEPFEQSTGIVHLTKRDDAHVAQTFNRFETLTGFRRYEHIMNHPEAEKMRGNHIYRAFNHIVHYGESFRGIKDIACMGMEAAGRVSVTVNANDPADQRLCDTPMTDSFMQFAGFLVNYFNNPSLEDVLVCMKIERIEIGGSFTPDTTEWIVYSNMTEGGDSDASADAYVFDAVSKKMVMAAFGFRFSKMSQFLLARMLKSVNRKTSPNKQGGKIASQSSDDPVVEVSMLQPKAAKKSSSKRADVFQVLSNVTDIPLKDLKDESTLEDLGIDSLMATEVLNDIRATLGLTIDLTSFLFFQNIQAIASYVDSKLGGDQESNSDSSQVDNPATDTDTPSLNSRPVPSTSLASKSEHQALSASISLKSSASNRPAITSSFNSFNSIRLGYDQLAVGTKAVNFCKQVYPDQARLVLAYVTEAYAKLGCDLKDLLPGDPVPALQSLPRHKRFVRQLYRVLEDAQLISPTEEGFVRTNFPVDLTPAETLYQRIIDPYPQHINVHKLVKAVGSELASCLVGEKDGLQVVFGDKTNKHILEDIYQNWPLLRTPTLLLGDFLINAFTNFTGSGKFRLLEIGAGTGGTTRYIINHLQTHGIPFEYMFTDISSSLVTAARKHFKGVEGMSFELLDIEKPPKLEYEGAFHVIIATNCIHATRKLPQSLLHLRKMLREDGALMLVEITKNMFWLDIVVGLFEGWWLFEDGRSHALVNEKHWERLMKEVGFKEVLWTDGSSPESKMVRVIGAFPSAPSPKATSGTKENKKVSKAALETVIYKRVGDIDIHADVYYPTHSELPTEKMPIGKLTLYLSKSYGTYN